MRGLRTGEHVAQEGSLVDGHQVAIGGVAGTQVLLSSRNSAMGRTRSGRHRRRPHPQHLTAFRLSRASSPQGH